MDLSPASVQVGPLHLRTTGEHQHLRDLREEAFSPWVRGLPPRWAINAASRVSGGFFLEARRADRKLVGYLFAAPMRWNGDAATLPPYEEVHAALLYQELPSAFARLFDRHRLRRYDTVVLLTVLVDPEERRRQLPTALLGEIRRRALDLGWRHLVSPFRPSGYGRYKEQGRLAHTEEAFRRYCSLTDESGLPADPWLRSLARHGLKMLKLEMRSVRRPRSLRYFEAFRRRFKPDRWYETSEGVWECGEVPTWYVDPRERKVWLIEPNVWGSLPLEADSS